MHSVVRRPDERLDGFGGNVAAEFDSCLHDIDMGDMPSKGFWFSWTSKRGGAGDNKSRIDRAVTNPFWVDDFPEAEANELHPGISDHWPVIVTGS